jgi:hypothetical protein
MNPGTLLRHPALREKILAFLIHLGLSACIVGLVAALMLFIWYPQPWFMHDGGWTVFQLILAVDVVLGPLLTLIIYRRGKPGLKRDLSIIAAVQLGALAFGMTTMLQHRPVYVVYAENNFFAITWAQLRHGTKDMDRLDAFKTTSNMLPMAYLQLPADAAERARLRSAAGQGGPLVISLGDHYRPLSATDWKEILRQGPDIETLARSDADIAAALQRFRASHAGVMETIAFVPVVCRNDVLMLAIDRNTFRVVGWLD